MDATTCGNDVGAVGLEDVAVDLWTCLVGRITLQGFGGLAELQVDTKAVAAMDGQVGIQIEDKIRLVDAEDVAEYVIRAEIVNPTSRVVEVVLIVAVEGVVEGGAAGKRAGKGRGRESCGCSLPEPGRTRLSLRRAARRRPAPARRRSAAPCCQRAPVVERNCWFCCSRTATRCSRSKTSCFSCSTSSGAAVEVCAAPRRQTERNATTG